MARGWESKSVEEQVAASQASTFSGSAPDARQQQQEKAHLARQRQTLNLQREHILSQRTSNPARRAALAAALEQIETQIKALE